MSLSKGKWLGRMAITRVESLSGGLFRGLRDSAVDALSPAQRGELRARQLQSVMALGPAMMAANVFNAAVLVWTFRDSPLRVFAMIWALALALGVALWAMAQRHQRRSPRTSVSPRGHRRLTLHALAFGALWGAPALAFPFAGAAQQQILEVCTAGMACGGAVALAPIWRSSAAFTAALLAPALAMFARQGGDAGPAVAAFGLSFAAVIFCVVYDRNRMFTANFAQSLRLTSANADLATKVESLEEFGDVTFESDSRGRLTKASRRFAGIFRMTEAELIGADVFALIAGAVEGESAVRDAGLRAIIRAARARSAFRDVAVRLRLRGEEAWVAVSGKPLFDDAFTFTGYRGAAVDVTAAKRAERALARARDLDPLTGLANRETFLERVRLHLASPEKGRFAVLAIDFDRLKNVNEVVGRESADHVLKTCAKRIAAALRPHDLAARFSADDFFVLATGADDPANVDAAVDRLLHALGEPVAAQGVRLPISAFVGVALSRTHGEDRETLVRNAELAVRRGRGEGQRVTFFDDAADSELRERRRLELLLIEAVEKSQLDVHFQPLVDVATGRVVACEALLRWTHPVRGPIPPSVFVPIAEETGLILKIGEWVLRRSCAEAALWSDDVRIAVNLSAVQFRSGLTALVRDALVTTGLPAHRLELEVTETALIGDKDRALREMHSLRALGVKLSLDDFGTGYASLSYLADMPFDKIKIDRSFVKEVATRHDSGAIVQAITDLASRLGLNTTAEGVETLQDLEWLRAAGCKEAQGFLFSRAAPAEQIRALIARNGPEALGKIAA